MPLTRRHLLRAMASSLAAPAFLRGRRARANDARPLLMPAIDSGRLDGGKRIFDLRIADGVTEFFADQATRTIGINAPFLGPILRMQAGDPVLLNVTNTLADPAALHWHGLHLPAAADGGPHQPVAAGATWSPEFTVKQKAGSFWFHAHQHGMTGAHVWAGMAGMIRIEDAEEASLPLPRRHGEDDFTLILQNRSFDAAFQMPYAPGQHERMAGMQGDQLLVNGQIGTYLPIKAPRIRLRLLNGSNGTVYRLHFADGRSFRQIASDGGLLRAPVSLTEAALAPGERAEFIVELHDGDVALLRAELFGAESPFAGSNGLRDVLEIRPAGAQPPAPALPARLAGLTAPPPRPAPPALSRWK